MNTNNACSLSVMDRAEKTRLANRVKVFKALAHESRLFIVEELSCGERCVCELTAMIGADMSTVSNHLSILKNAGIVTSEKRGQQVYYRLRLPCVLSFAACVDAAVEPYEIAEFFKG